MRLSPPLHTQNNEGHGGFDECNPNAAIRRLVVDRKEGRISNDKDVLETTLKDKQSYPFKKVEVPRKIRV